MIQLNPLRESLESNPTVLRVYRSISLELDEDFSKWELLCNKIANVYYKLNGPKPIKVRQRSVFVDKNGCMVNSYPIEFIPIMVNIIKDYLNTK